MSNEKIISGGGVHSLPEDLEGALKLDREALVGDEITPLARNEWICWIQSAM